MQKLIWVLTYLALDNIAGTVWPGDGYAAPVDQRPGLARQQVYEAVHSPSADLRTLRSKLHIAGKNTNRVRVLVEGDLLRFYVNARVVVGLAKTRPPDGKAGILVLEGGKPGIQVGFDNGQIRSPPGKYELASETEERERLTDHEPFADASGHLSPTAFDFVVPGVRRGEVDKRLGKPYVSSISLVAQGQIDLFLDAAPTVHSNRQHAPQPTEDVHYYDYRPDEFSSEYARIVFRNDNIWYAMLPVHDERTRGEVIARYGNIFEEQKVQRRRGHVLSVDVILWLRKKGLAFVEKPGQGITHRVVFPAECADCDETSGKLGTDP